MDTKTRLRKALLTEGKHGHKNDYGCVMVFLKIDKKDWDGILDQIDEEDLYQPEDDPSYGKEDKPHVTILYGLHDTIEDSEIEPDLKDIKEPSIKIKGISEFSNPKFDVLKFDVDSEDLHKLNKRFNEYPTTQTYPDYHPHMTIAYLKPKMAEKYKKKFKDIKDLKFEADHIVYSKVDGTNKTYDFKG
jgi:2'-5' RNA ligase